ncbi:hypothetical protein [Mesorhizobium sp. SARCC-RB16n]|uniref:hypothetical protein n=1 Tax=Mesorhizobium sp. SARCC-RB16n TaxID=2116687 RepID=UPI001FEF4B8E|nr:hypothetical protein [Mesorhizobium sp. SARCC-RB16n]
MATMHLDAESKAELHAEAAKLIARYESPLETLKALMAYNCGLETQILALPVGIRNLWLSASTRRPCAGVTGPALDARPYRLHWQ